MASKTLTFVPTSDNTTYTSIYATTGFHSWQTFYHIGSPDVYTVGKAGGIISLAAGNEFKAVRKWEEQGNFQSVFPNFNTRNYYLHRANLGQDGSLSSWNFLPIGGIPSNEISTITKVTINVIIKSVSGTAVDLGCNLSPVINGVKSTEWILDTNQSVTRAGDGKTIDTLLENYAGWQFYSMDSSTKTAWLTATTIGNLDKLAILAEYHRSGSGDGNGLDIDAIEIVIEYDPVQTDKLYTPILTSQTTGTAVNDGSVEITWNINDPPASEDLGVSNDNVSYEIEYTENYEIDNTDWHTLRRRLIYTDSSYTWNVGKMIKSDSVRLRIRAVSLEDTLTSEWSMSEIFAINVHKLSAPVIANPTSGAKYSDFILIILDESVTQNTYHQKVKYTLEYSSKIHDIDWTVIIKDAPTGTAMIRWNIEDLLPATDYSLRLTAKNSATTDNVPDQIARSFVYDISIEQPGTFIIDTKPPQSLLEIEGGLKSTNELRHTINIFAEDETTEIEKIQIRECNASTQLNIGDISELQSEDECTDISGIEDISDLGKPQDFPNRTI